MVKQTRHSPVEMMDATALRRLTMRTVETYPDEWKVVHEALQNAIDAIQKTGRVDGQVSVLLNLNEESVVVADNGVGFPHRMELLSMGGTDKDLPSEQRAHIRGKQGVGLKAVIYSTCRFSLTSVVDGHEWQVSVADACDYVETGDVTFIEHAAQPSDAPNGTRVEYRFAAPMVSHFVGDVIDRFYEKIDTGTNGDPVDRCRMAIEYYFRSYSYAGCVDRLLGAEGVAPIAIRIEIIAPKGISDLSSSDRLQAALGTGRALVSQFENKFWDVEEAIDARPPRRWRPAVRSETTVPDRGDIGSIGDQYVWTCRMTEPEQFASLLRNDQLRTPIDIGQYKAFFESVAGIYIAVGSVRSLDTFAVEGARQIIAASGVPTVHAVQPPPRGQDATYVAHNIYFVLNLKADLNYGKQTISNTRLIGTANHFFRDAVRATLRNVAANIAGALPAGGTADDMQRRGEPEVGVVLRPNLKLADLAMAKEPYEENSVIALFFELLGRGHIRDLRFYSVNSKTQYDARFIGRLSRQRALIEPKSDQDLSNLEFKIALDDLIRDFEEGDKYPDDIQLIVVWTYDPDKQYADYQVVDIEETGQEDRRLPCVTKVLNCRRFRYEIQMIVLQDLVAELADSQSPK